jgi:hypothetical protein
MDALLGLELTGSLNHGQPNEETARRFVGPHVTTQRVDGLRRCPLIWIKERPRRVIRDRVEPAVGPRVVRYAAESGSELSCGDAAVPETATNDRPPAANGAATVSASALALHLDCSRPYMGKLEAEGMIQRSRCAPR